jgi:hypothetical protein
MINGSGNALNSDSPSYFTQFFTVHSGDNLKTLYIDRDPAIFKDIVRHLQGYLVTPRNEEHFVYHSLKKALIAGIYTAMQYTINFRGYDNACFEISMCGSVGRASRYQGNCLLTLNRKEIPKTSFQWVRLYCSDLTDDRVWFCDGKSLS